VAAPRDSISPDMPPCRSLLPASLILLAAVGGSHASAAEAAKGETKTPATASAAGLGGLEPKVKSYIEAHCMNCHDEESQKGDFRMDVLSSKVGFEDNQKWLEVMERINSGEMPPKGELRPAAAGLVNVDRDRTDCWAAFDVNPWMSSTSGTRVRPS